MGTACSKRCGNGLGKGTRNFVRGDNGVKHLSPCSLSTLQIVIGVRCMKIITNEECMSKHKLLVIELEKRHRKFQPCLHIWKLKEDRLERNLQI